MAEGGRIKKDKEIQDEGREEKRRIPAGTLNKRDPFQGDA